jgi:hypothetical protein
MTKEITISKLRQAEERLYVANRVLAAPDVTIEAKNHAIDQKYINMAYVNHYEKQLDKIILLEKIRLAIMKAKLRNAFRNKETAQ